MAKAIIMAGGLGERFWPLTTAEFPKYCIPFEKQSLLERTYRRLQRLYKTSDIYVITTRSQKNIIRRELPQLKASNLLLEPFRNNTAPAILFTCEALRKKYGREEVVSFYPADHLIQNNALFHKTMALAIDTAKKTENLVVLGIRPSFPATGYGYIQSGSTIPGLKAALCVERFVEKPNRKRAKIYLQKGNFYWNSGIFTWKTGVLIDAMKKYAPEQDYKHSGLSIDCAVLEKADNVVFCKTEMDWCDLGNWDMWHEKLPKDAKQNHVEGAVRLKEVSRSLIINRDPKRPLTIEGAADIIIVHTPNGTLVCRRGHAEEAARLGSKK